jgi:hypothetical protein
MRGNAQNHADFLVKNRRNRKLSLRLMRSRDNVLERCICYPHFMVGIRLPLIFILKDSNRFILIAIRFGVAQGTPGFGEPLE